MDSAEAEIRAGLAALVEPGQVFEIRSWTGDRISSGYFSDLDAAARAIDALDAAGPDGIYLTPNPVNPDLLSRRANRIKDRMSKKDASTADTDITGRRWFLVDIDPARPSGVSSSDDEHAAALERAAVIAAALGERGWPAPAAGDSGNGAHLLYRLDLPNDEQTTALIKAALGALDALFSDSAAEVDTAVYNASRIWKVYGTVARKGDSTPSRPHRRSRLLSVPETWEIVTREQLAALAIADPTPPAPATPGRTNGNGNGRKKGEPIDLGAWLRDHGIGVMDERPYQGGTLYRLDSCPFGGAHKDGAHAIQFPSGAIFAGCHHKSCGGGTQRWPDLREKFEGADYRKRKAAAKREAEERTPAPAPGEVTRSAGEVGAAEATEDPAILAEAREVLTAGDPLAYMVAAYNLEHIGDPVLGQCLALSLASRLVRNTGGLHVMVTGESGKGKSHGYRAMLRQVPDGFKLKGSFSDKSLYYMDDLRPQSVICVDDKDLSDSIQATLKEATTDFREPIIHRTLTTERKPVVYMIPARCLWWIAKLEGCGDDQVLNRMLMVWVDESEEQDRAVLAAMLERESRDDDAPAEEPRAVAVCRAMWEILHGAGLPEVSIARFGRRIRFDSARNRRNPDMFIDMIKAAALLRTFQREQRSLPDGLIRIYATEEDFKTAAGVYTALHGDAGSQGDKLTKREADVLDLIAKAGLREFTIGKLQTLTKLSYHAVYKMMSGYASRGANYSGLLEKCPAVSTLDKTVSTRSDDDAGRIQRRVIGYTFSPDVYRHWRTGGIVWLADPDPADGPDPGGDSCLHLQHVCSTFAAPAANNETGDTAPVDGTGDEGTKKNDDGSLFAADPDNGEPPAASLEGVHTPLSVPGICSKQDPDLEDQSGIEDLDPEPAPIVCSNGCKRAANVPQLQQTTGPAPDLAGADPGTRPPAPVLEAGSCSLEEIDPADYLTLADGQLIDHCRVCGARLVHYKERWNVAKSAGRLPRLICRGCYGRAKAREQSAIVTLPGAAPIADVVPVPAGSLGRCGICGLEAAAYKDQGGRTPICPSCYSRLAQEQVDIR